MNRFTPGNAVELLRSGGEYFPAMIEAIDVAQREVWLETYIFADDAAGRAVAVALIAAAGRGVIVRVLVDGWGAKYYLTPSLEHRLREGGVRLLKYRPEVAPWQFRLHRLRRMHRKLCHVDREVAFVAGTLGVRDVQRVFQIAHGSSRNSAHSMPANRLPRARMGLKPAFKRVQRRLNG